MAPAPTQAPTTTETPTGEPSTPTGEPSTTASPGTTAGSGSTGAPGPTVPNPGGAGSRFQLTIEQIWPQEPTGYTRTAEVVVPTTTAGQKLPVVIFLHGNGGQGNTQPIEKVFTEDNVVIVCPSGYERSWNVYTEKSKADDVSFILDLIKKIGTDIPAADMNDVNIIGSSNGAALTYRLMIETGLDRPFHRAFPMVSSLIGPQYNTDTFWKANYGETNVYDIAVVPQFSSNFVYAHFHGTNDGAIKYEGQNPGPMFLGQAEVLSAQRTDYLFAKAMGYTGDQIEDSAGVMDGSDVQVYTYLGGRVRHFKIIDGTHGNSGIGNNNVAAVVKEAIVGSK